MTAKRVVVCLGLGSNIAPERNIPEAIGLLHRNLTILKISSAWESVPVGTGGPNFINAAVLVETVLSPSNLKKKIIRPIEQQLGRVRSKNKNAPRTIDIDILIWNDLILDRQLTKHAHTAVPVAEVISEIQTKEFDSIKKAADHYLKSATLKLRLDILSCEK